MTADLGTNFAQNNGEAAKFVFILRDYLLVLVCLHCTFDCPESITGPELVVTAKR